MAAQARAALQAVQTAVAAATSPGYSVAGAAVGAAVARHDTQATETDSVAVERALPPTPGALSPAKAAGRRGWDTSAAEAVGASSVAHMVREEDEYQARQALHTAAMQVSWHGRPPSSRLLRDACLRRLQARLARIADVAACRRALGSLRHLGKSWPRSEASGRS